MGNILAIISHGTEFIITDIFPDIGYELSASIMIDEIKQYAHYLGVYYNSNTNKVMIQTTTLNNGQIAIQTAGIATASNISASGCIGVKRQFTLIGPSRHVDDEMLETSQSTKALAIFAGYYNGNVENYHGKGKFYGLKVLDPYTAEIKSEIVPWLDDENVPCVKDLKTGALYYNTGSGNFGYIDLNNVVHNT